MTQPELDAVRARLSEFDRTYDRGIVLCVAAVDEVSALLIAVPGPDDDLESLLEALHAAGFVHWCRYLVMDEGEDQQEFLSALDLFAPVYSHEPEGVPDAVRSMFDDDPPDAGDVPDALAARALHLLRLAVGLADPSHS